MKLELKIESFKKSPCMVKFKERKFLLVVINIMQAIIILLMLGLLVFMAEEKEAAPVPDLFCLGDNESLDSVRILLDILGVGLIPLLAWLSMKGTVSYDGVSRYNWGEESLLREDGDGLWHFGPAGDGV